MIKYLRSKGFQINYGMNITDIDDKIVKKVHNLNNNNNNNIRDKYNNFIKNQEERFWDDLKSLNIDKPNKILRVSDVIPDIIHFISKLIDSEFAYVSNGSVYFSMDKYLDNFDTIMNNSNEDDMSIKNDFNNEKKNSNDFALWKAEKENDISWSSPWGYGRPGWHIECSVMMNNMFGKVVDIHSGGIDLKFPHHHNEYVQTTAFYSEENLIKCFIHSGHLHIDNVKMSQSLGNYTTIKEFLKFHHPNILRILFLMGSWSSHFNLTEETIQTAKSYHENIKNFVVNLNYYEKTLKLNSLNNEISNKNEYESYYNEILSNLDNNFNTHEVFKILFEMVNKVNKDFIENKLLLSQIENIKKTIHFVINIFGLKFDQIENINNNNNDIGQYIESIIEIRNDLRNLAKNEKDKEFKKKLFSLTDKIRDKVLPDLGVTLEDTGGVDKWYFN